MAAFIFVTMVAIFEPIAILILIKIINGIKHKEKEQKRPIQKKTANMGYSALFGLASILIVFLTASLLGFGLSFIQGRSLFPDLLFEENFFITVLPSIPNFQQGSHI